MDKSKFKAADAVIALSALVLFLASFFEWFSADIVGDISGELAVNGWETDGAFFWVFLPIALGFAMVAVTLVRRTAVAQLPDLGMGWGQILFFAGLLAFALVVLKFLLSEDVPDVRGVEIDVSRSTGLFLALLAGAGLLVGGILERREDRARAGGRTAPPTPF